MIVHDSGAVAALQQLWSDIEHRYEERRHDIERPILAPHELFLTPQELSQAAEPLTSITLEGLQGGPGRCIPTTASINYPDRKSARPAHRSARRRAARATCQFPRRLRWPGADRSRFPGPARSAAGHAAAACHRVTAVPDWATFAAGEARLALTVAPDIGGLQLQTPRIALLSESQLFGARASQERRRRRSAADPQAILRDLTDLNPGSPVVHEEYGVGRLRRPHGHGNRRQSG